MFTDPRPTQTSYFQFRYASDVLSIVDVSIILVAVWQAFVILLS